MHLLGDDVVDLAMTKRSPRIAERFRGRVLSRGERARLEGALDSELLLWRYWAAKEAAFKIGTRLDTGLRFDHARFEVEGEGHDGRVRHPDFEVTIRWTEGPDWIHASAFFGEPMRWATAVQPIASVEESIDSLHPSELASAPHLDSRAARVLARRLLADLGASPDVALLRTGGPILVTRAGAKTSERDPRWDVSLSHDGRYVSATVAATGLLEEA